ncbi:hypothetical protein TNCV_4628551 [Trichonephila clavipes]|nr:hypothetical protein TNCV_4628551 [Trichonephila clavipes]
MGSGTLTRTQGSKYLFWCSSEWTDWRIHKLTIQEPFRSPLDIRSQEQMPLCPPITYVIGYMMYSYVHGYQRQGYRCLLLTELDACHGVIIIVYGL